MTARHTTMRLDNTATPRSARSVNVTPSGNDATPHVTIELTAEHAHVVANLTPDEARSLSQALLVAIR